MNLAVHRLRMAASMLLGATLLSPLVLADDASEIRARSFTLLNQGVSAYKRGEYARAETALADAASIALNNFRAHFYLGLARNGTRDYRGAVEALTIALDLDPGHLQSHVAIGDAYLKMGDLNESQASYFRALKIRPEYPAALDGVARVYEAQLDEDRAIATFRRAIDSNRGYAPAYTHLGDLYLRQDRFEEAVLLLEEAVDVRPDYAPGLNRLALAYGRLGLDNQAVATIQKAIELEPGNAIHPATLGRLQLDQGFVGAAEESFREALTLDPALPIGRAGLAEVARRRGEYAAAIRQVDVALNDPRTEAAFISRLEAYRTLIVDERNELATLEDRSATSSATSEDYNALADIYAGRAMWEQAAEALALVDPTPEQQELLAYMLFQAGRYADARAIYSSLASDVDSPSLALNNGVTLAMLGDDDGAVVAYERALELDPEHLEARLYLGNALLRLGHEDAAVAQYLEFLNREEHGESAERVRRILKQVAPEALRESGPETAPTPGGPVLDLIDEGAPS